MFLVLFFSVFVANAQVPPPPVSPVFLKNQTKTTNIKNSNLK